MNNKAVPWHIPAREAHSKVAQNKTSIRGARPGVSDELWDKNAIGLRRWDVATQERKITCRLVECMYWLESCIVPRSVIESGLFSCQKGVYPRQVLVWAFRKMCVNCARVIFLGNFFNKQSRPPQGVWVVEKGGKCQFYIIVEYIIQTTSFIIPHIIDMTKKEIWLV